MVGRDKIEQTGAFSKTIIDNSLNKQDKNDDLVKKIIVGIIVALIAFVLEEIIRNTF